VTRLEKLRGSTNNVCAADRRPACILEELHDTPCPGHAIVLVTCLYASQLCRPTMISNSRPANSGTKTAASETGVICHFPRRTRPCHALVYTASRQVFEATLPDARPTILALHV
jgi:hypothetical protein